MGRTNAVVNGSLSVYILLLFFIDVYKRQGYEDLAGDLRMLGACIDKKSAVPEPL